MSLRLKLLLLFALAVAAAAGFTAWNAERYAEAQFQQADEQRSGALVAQFRRELSEREAEVTTSVQTIADAESTLRMVLDLSRSGSDPSVYAGDARGLAASHQLDFLELAGADGTLISSAQWPERVGYKNDWVTRQADWNRRGAFLDRVEVPDGVELALVAVRIVHAGNLNVYIIGGERLNSTFLETLSLPAGMRALLYRNLETDFVPAALSDAEGPVSGAESFQPLIASLQQQPPGPGAATIDWKPESGAERFVALPLTGRQGELLGALLLGSAQDQRIALENYIGASALGVAAVGLLLAFFLSGWISARVSRPLARLSEAIAEVSSGDWDARVEPGGVPEVAQAIGGFNKMTRQLTDDRAGQAARERAAAWRQLAGQLAGELKTLLPPLQKAVEGLARPDEATLEPEGDFGDEIAPDRAAAAEAAAARLQPASSAMRQTLETLAACAGKLGEFAALPVPRLEAIALNDAMRAAVQSFEPRFSAIGRPPITPELFLDDRVGLVRADAVLLRRALDNLLLFLIEDMPAGGTFTIHTRRQDDMAHMILAGSGSGVAAQRGDSRAADRAARVSGIGLSLATVQSIVSSHGGKISIEASPLAGTTFYLDWPVFTSQGSGVAAAPTNLPALPSVLQNEPREQPREAPAEIPVETSAKKTETAKREPEAAQAPAGPAERAFQPAQQEPQPAQRQTQPGQRQNQEDAKQESSAAALEEPLALHPVEPPLAPREHDEPQPFAESPAKSFASGAPVDDHKHDDRETLELILDSAAEPVSGFESEPRHQPEPLAQSSADLAVSSSEPAIAEAAHEVNGSTATDESSLESVAQSNPQPPAGPEQELQPVGAGAAQGGENELAAVIEEVIETPACIFRTSPRLLNDAAYRDAREEFEVEPLPFAGSVAAIDAGPGLFGIAVPASVAGNDSETQPAVPASAISASAIPSPAVSATAGPAKDAPAQQLPAEKISLEPSAAPAAQVPEPVAAKPAAEPEPDASRRIPYRPLTYRW